MVVFLILLTVVAIFLFLTGTLRTVSSVVIALVVLLFFGVGLIVFAENAVKDPNAVLFVGGFTAAICLAVFFGGRRLMLKYDPLQKPNDDQPDSSKK